MELLAIVLAFYFFGFWGGLGFLATYIVLFFCVSALE